jgi:calcium binding protein 39
MLQLSPLVCLQKHAFEVASDAFHTFKVLLTQHRDVTTAYLEIPDNYDAFFSKFDELLTSENYATQRQVRRDHVATQG